MIVWQAHKSRIRHMAFAPDGSELATTAGTSKYVWLWQAATGATRGKLFGHVAHARGVAYSPDGRFVASTQNAPYTTVWNRPHGHVVAALERRGGASRASRSARTRRRWRSRPRTGRRSGGRATSRRRRP